MKTYLKPQTGIDPLTMCESILDSVGIFSSFTPETEALPTNPSQPSSGGLG